MEKYETYRATCPKCGNMDHFSETVEFKKRHTCSKCKEQFEVSNHLMYKTDIKPEVHETVQQERQARMDGGTLLGQDPSRVLDGQVLPHGRLAHVDCPECKKKTLWSVGAGTQQCTQCGEMLYPSVLHFGPMDLDEKIQDMSFRNKLREARLRNRAAEDVALDLEIRQFKDSLEKVGVRYDQDKLRWDLVPMHLLEGMVKVLMVGMKKYSAHNWRKGLHTTRISNSLQRHLNAYLAGEELDPESGLPHVDHILCNALFLKGQAVEHPEMDDRYRRPISGIGH